MATSVQQRQPLGLFPSRRAPGLYDRVIEVLRVHHYSLRTEEAYVHWIRRYIEFHFERGKITFREGSAGRLAVVRLRRCKNVWT